MSIRLVAMPHPFRSDRIIREEIDPRPLAELFGELGSPLPIQHARFAIDDRIVSDPALVPPDGSTVIIKVVPRGGGGEEKTELQKTGKAEFWGGLLLAAVGVILLFIPATQGLGIALIGAGVSAMAGGIALYNTEFDVPKTPGTPEASQQPSIRGSRNRTNLGGTVPLVLGRHLLVPDHGALPFTSVTETAQYLHQLFVAGYNDLVVEAGSLKIGDTPLASYSEVLSEIITDGSPSTYYPEICNEIMIGRRVKKLAEGGGSGAIVQRTSSGTRKIGVDIVFPRGLALYDEDGNVTGRVIDFRAYYKKAGAPDDDYQLLGYWDGQSTIIHEATNKTLRKSIVKTLDNADPEGADWCPDLAYDVKLSRETGDSGNPAIIDEVYWGSLRCFRLDRPIKPTTQAELCVVGLKILASDQLQGVIDQFNCVVQTRILDYAGPGSGPEAWQLALTSNPASMVLYMLTSHVNPRPVSYDRIDWPALESWHGFCDEHGYECNAVIAQGQGRDQILEAICTAGRAHLGRIDGKFTVILDAERSTPIQHFTPRNSWGFSGQKLFLEVPHALKVAFLNAEMGWQSDERVVYAEGYGEETATVFRKVDGWGITGPDQAFKAGRYMLACTLLRPEVFTVNVDIEHLVCTRGDRVLLSHDVPLFGISAGRIKELTTDEFGAVTHIGSDELLPMEAGKSYGLTIRKSDGSFVTCRLITYVGEQSTVELEEPIPAGNAPALGDLFSFGEWGVITVDCIIAGIEPGEDLSAKLTLVEYAPEIFGIDDPEYEIPPYDPKITKPGDVDQPPLIIDLPNAASDIKDLSDRAASTAASRPFYTELQEGYEAAGGTKIPTVPTISLCKAVGTKAIVIAWDRQANLTNWHRYEIQVSDDEVSWYSLKMDGTDWKDILDADTDWSTEYIVHAGIPHAGDPDDPVGRTLFYRVRRVTKEALASDWSVSASATSNTVENGDLGANSIYANNLRADAITADKIQTGFLSATQAVVIGQDFVGEPVPGSQRVVIDKNECRLEEWDGNSWVTITQFGGDDELKWYLQARGLVKTGADISGLPIGDRAPSGAKIFQFEGNAQDQNGNDPWTKNGIAYDITNKKFGSGSVTDGGSGGSLVDEDANGIELGHAFGIDFWHRPAAFPASTQKIVDLRIADPDGAASEGAQADFSSIDSSVEMVPLNETQTVLIGADGSGFAYAVIMQTEAGSTACSFGTVLTLTGSGSYWLSAARLTDSSFVLVTLEGATLKAYVCTVSGTTITKNSGVTIAENFDPDSIYYRRVQVASIDATHVFCVYAHLDTGSYTVYCGVGTVSGTTTSWSIDTVDAVGSGFELVFVMATVLDSSTAIAGYRRGDTHGRVFSVVTITDGVPSAAAIQSFTGEGGDFSSIRALDNTRFLCVFNSPLLATYGQVFSLSGGTLTGGPYATILADGIPAHYPIASSGVPGLMTVFYFKSNTQSACRMVDCGSSGTTITLKTERLLSLDRYFWFTWSACELRGDPHRYHFASYYDVGPAHKGEFLALAATTIGLEIESSGYTLRMANAADNWSDTAVLAKSTTEVWHHLSINFELATTLLHLTCDNATDSLSFAGHTLNTSTMALWLYLLGGTVDNNVDDLLILADTFLDETDDSLAHSAAGFPWVDASTGIDPLVDLLLLTKSEGKIRALNDLILPASDPTGDNQATHKAYVDSRAPLGVTTQTGNYTVAADISLVLMNNTSDAIVTLDSSTSMAGRVVRIKKLQSIAVVTVAPSSGTLDGESSWKIYEKGDCMAVAFDGTNWRIV